MHVCNHIMETNEISVPLPVLTIEQRCEIIENSELDSPSGQLSVELNCELLSLYLLQNDTNNMKYLWKRIPDIIKLKSPELQAIWEVGKALWKHNYSGIIQNTWYINNNNNNVLHGRVHDECICFTWVCL